MKLAEKYIEMCEAKDYLEDSVELDDYRDFEKKYKGKHKFDNYVDVKGDEVFLNKKGLKELRSSIKAFDGKITAKRVKDVEKGLDSQANDAIKSIVSDYPEIDPKKIKVSTYVGTDYEDISSGGSTHTTVEYDGDDVELDGNAFLGNDNAYDAMSDGFDSWDWLAMLADEDSPWYDTTFVDMYIEDQASQAVEALADLDAQGELENKLREFFNNWK